MQVFTTEVVEGSIWVSSNLGHPPSTLRVLKVSASSAKVRNITRRGSKQHRGKTYTIPLDCFRVHFRRLR